MRSRLGLGVVFQAYPEHCQNSVPCAMELKTVFLMALNCTPSQLLDATSIPSHRALSTTYSFLQEDQPNLFHFLVQAQPG